jgi:hypothetical protein
MALHNLFSYFMPLSVGDFRPNLFLSDTLHVESQQDGAVRSVADP